MATITFTDKVFHSQLLTLCSKLLSDGCLQGDCINMYAQIKMNDTIYRGDPIYELDQAWYDWANVDWQNDIVPAKLLLFLDLRATFVHKFEVGSSIVSEPGIYAAAYSLVSNPSKNDDLKISNLVDYGTIMKNKDDQPELILFNIESIVEAQITCPYKTSDNNISAEEWLFLQPRNKWYDVLLEVIRKGLKDAVNNEATAEAAREKEDDESDKEQSDSDTDSDSNTEEEKDGNEIETDDSDIEEEEIIIQNKKPNKRIKT